MTATRFLKAFIVPVIAAGLLLGAFPAVAGKPAAGTEAAAPEIREFSAWRLQCASKAECTLFQHVTTGKEGDKNAPIVLAAVVHITTVKGKEGDKDGDKEQTMVRLVTPLGTALLAGIQMQIDDDKPIQVPYMRCLPGGCVTEIIFADDMLDKLKKGKEISVTYTNVEGKPKPYKLSLKGFPAGLAALESSSKKG
jgi:invasion protein IalB